MKKYSHLRGTLFDIERELRTRNSGADETISEAFTVGKAEVKTSEVASTDSKLKENKWEKESKAGRWMDWRSEKLKKIDTTLKEFEKIKKNSNSDQKLEKIEEIETKISEWRNSKTDKQNTIRDEAVIHLEEYLESQKVNIKAYIKYKEEGLIIKEKEWDMTPEVWYGYSETETKQCKNDAIIWYNTLFPRVVNKEEIEADLKSIKQWNRNTVGVRLANHEASQVGKEIMKKIFITLALAKIKTGGSKDSGGEVEYNKMNETDIPLAGLISHGQRISLRFGPDQEKDRKNVSNDFKNYVFKSPKSKEKLVLEDRGYASHDSEIGEATGKVIEWKTTIYALIGSKRHYGVPLTLGGAGNPSAMKDANVTIGGFCKNTNTNTVEEVQQGHFYLNTGAQEGKDKGYANLMFGFEGTAPGESSAYGKSHNALSGLFDQSESYSITGGLKMKKFSVFENIPLEYAGTQGHVDETILEKIGDIYEAKKGDHQFFKDILVKSPGEAATHCEEEYQKLKGNK